ncbi:MAG: cell division protein ZipA [Gammaproteobacteria bacterium]|nr:cell division protein ZipA [Gammaproteobacteria bacterium]
MSELRLILLIAGVLLIIGIFLYSRRAERKSTARSAPRREPSFDTFVSESDTPPQARAETVTTPPPVVAAEDAFEQSELPLPEELRPDPVVNTESDEESQPAVKEKVVVIHVSAKGGTRFRGPAIIKALEEESLEYGEFNIFHRRVGQNSVYSVATMVEPGTFDLENIESLTTPGLSLFLVLPGPDSPVGAFTEMLTTARRLAATLDGEVLDESGSTLSRQAASHLREQIIEFAHRIR